MLRHNKKKHYCIMKARLSTGLFYLPKIDFIDSFRQMNEIIKYPGCFVCGDDNNFGLKAKFYYENGEAITRVVADKRFEGYRGIYHGGIITSLLDEVMIKAILAENKYAVTAEIKVRFKKPIITGEKLKISGRVRSRKGRLFYTEARAVLQNGELVASAEAKCIEAKSQLKAELMKSISSTN